MKTKHTKGEWSVVNELDMHGQETNYFAVTTGNEVICITGEELEINGETEANAKLIAAAPDLLRFVIEIANRYPNSPWIYEEANNLIKKATE